VPNSPKTKFLKKGDFDMSSNLISTLFSGSESFMADLSQEDESMITGGYGGTSGVSATNSANTSPSPDNT
jgi:hypothetical protein